MAAGSICRWLPVLLGAGALATAHAASGEVREPCDHFEALRQPFFGDLHTHTALSFDAWLFENRNLPDDAYAFARGEPAPVSGAALPAIPVTDVPSHVLADPVVTIGVAGAGTPPISSTTVMRSA